MMQQRHGLRLEQETVAATRLVYCAWLSPSCRTGLELVSPLAHHSTELVGGGGNWNWEIAMVAGPGLSTGQGEAKALQEAGEEEEELHAGQGLSKANSATCK